MAAQRRPGFEPRRHPPDGRRRGACGGRSTKAGVRTPATLDPFRRPPIRARALNEGRGSNPGDTREPRAEEHEGETLNEGRGSNPGDTGRCPRPQPACRTTLNEGRGSNPGDTSSTSPDSTRWPCVAQRRPGFEPRRHRRRAGVVVDALHIRSTKAGVRTPATHRGEGHGAVSVVRSTKAGVRTPATPARPAHRPKPLAHAQRRPGFEPRRHVSGSRPDVGPALSRSTKAGVRTPATPPRLLRR